MNGSLKAQFAKDSLLGVVLDIFFSRSNIKPEEAANSDAKLKALVTDLKAVLRRNKVSKQKADKQKTHKPEEAKEKAPEAKEKAPEAKEKPEEAKQSKEGEGHQDEEGSDSEGREDSESDDEGESEEAQAPDIEEEEEEEEEDSSKVNLPDTENFRKLSQAFEFVVRDKGRPAAVTACFKDLHGLSTTMTRIHLEKLEAALRQFRQNCVSTLRNFEVRRMPEVLAEELTKLKDKNRQRECISSFLEMKWLMNMSETLREESFRMPQEYKDRGHIETEKGIPQDDVRYTRGMHRRVCMSEVLQDPGLDCMCSATGHALPHHSETGAGDIAALTARNCVLGVFLLWWLLPAKSDGSCGIQISAESGISHSDRAVRTVDLNSNEESKNKLIVDTHIYDHVEHAVETLCARNRRTVLGVEDERALLTEILKDRIWADAFLALMTAAGVDLTTHRLNEQLLKQASEEDKKAAVKAWNLKVFTETWWKKTHGTGLLERYEVGMVFWELCGGVPAACVHSILLPRLGFGQHLGDEAFGYHAFAAQFFDQTDDRNSGAPARDQFCLSIPRWHKEGNPDLEKKELGRSRATEESNQLWEHWKKGAENGVATIDGVRAFVAEVEKLCLPDPKSTDPTRAIPFEVFDLLFKTTGYRLDDNSTRMLFVVASTIGVSPPVPLAALLSREDPGPSKYWAPHTANFESVQAVFQYLFAKSDVGTKHLGDGRYSYLCEDVFKDALAQTNLGLDSKARKKLWADLKKSALAFRLGEVDRPTFIRMGLDPTGQDPQCGRLVKILQLTSAQTPAEKQLGATLRSGLWPAVIFAIVDALLPDENVPRAQVLLAMSKVTKNKYGLYPPESIIKILDQFGEHGMSLPVMRDLLQNMGLKLDPQLLRRSFDAVDTSKEGRLQVAEFCSGMHQLFLKALPEIVMDKLGLSVGKPCRHVSVLCVMCHSLPLCSAGPSQFCEQHERCIFVILNALTTLLLIFTFLLVTFSSFTGTGNSMGSMIQSLLAAGGAPWLLKHAPTTRDTAPCNR